MPHEGLPAAPAGHVRAHLAIARAYLAIAMKEREARHVGRLEETVALLRSAVARTPELGAALEALEQDVKERREALAV